MTINLEKAGICDAQEIYDMQIKAFQALLETYQDHSSSPGAEKLDRTVERLQEPFTDFYFIAIEGKHIGALRICTFEKLCKLKQIFILPEFQGHGYAQNAILMAESLYPDAERWELDTILQEEKLCHLYEKMGYKRTGKVEKIKDGMDLVFFVK